MISLSNSIALPRAAHRCAITFGGADIFHAVFDERIRGTAGWLAAQGVGADDVLRAELEAMT